MRIRRHNSEQIRSEAHYSDCGAYRYLLTRHWGPAAMVNFIMLNPSVADELSNDPTVERCERRARAMGYGAFSVTNIFAWRDTDPKAMRRAVRPVGPENDAVLISTAQTADLVIAAWGTHGTHMGREAAVLELLRSNGIALHHLGLSKHGHPRHPLYVPYRQLPEEWNTAG